MQITQKEIAERLGVSRQLVTHALNGIGNISERKRREVLEAAEEMGYRRNEVARAMATGKSRVVGLVSYDTSMEHIAAIVSGVMDETVKEGYAVKLLTMPDNESRADVSEIARLCSAWQLDGAVAVAPRPEAIAVFEEELGKSRFRLACIDITTPCNDIVVKTDDHSAFRAAVSHLVALGHRRIVHMCGPDHPMTSSRNAIFLKTLGEFGLPIESGNLIGSHLDGWADRRGIEAATNALFDKPERPTAVICAGDAAAMIVMRATFQRGLRVPDDLSVIGFGNFWLGAQAYPPLTSIAQPFREMGRLAVRRLLEHINCDAPTGSVEELPAHLIVRESTARPTV